jgi:hypothetical protein
LTGSTIVYTKVQKAAARSGSPRRKHSWLRYTVRCAPETSTGETMNDVVSGSFEWDSEKDDKNRRKHGIAFKHAAKLFEEPY